MYLPNASEQSTILTPAGSDDLRTALALLEEKWTLFYPLMSWRMIDFTPTLAADPSANSEAKLTGTGTGATRVDPLYGEAVPVDDDGDFIQPHGDNGNAIDATDRKAFKDAIEIHGHPQREETDDELELYGANADRVIRLTLLCSMCDRLGITVRVGDEFEFAGQTWEVKQACIPPRGRWKWTNIPLYIVCMCSVKKTGS